MLWDSRGNRLVDSARTFTVRSVATILRHRQPMTRPPMHSRFATRVLLAGLLLATACQTKKPAVPRPRVRTDLPAIAIIPAPRQITTTRGEPFTITAGT